MTKPIIDVQQVNKQFRVGNQEVPILKSITLTVTQGDFMVIFGPSGCGKSTLLHILLGLEEPTSGTVLFEGKDLYRDFSQDARSELRKRNVGMVYQQSNWIKSLEVLDNVAFPLLLNGIDQDQARITAHQKLTETGMSDWADYRPTELSSGQQQKVALSRAVSTDPRLIIADEPTGNLDYKSGVELMEHLTRLNSEGKTVVMVTHDLDYLHYANVAVEMFDGQLVKIHTGAEIPALEQKTERL
jgi:putative ABC transport system ATP-binding protein